MTLGDYPGTQSGVRGTLVLQASRPAPDLPPSLAFPRHLTPPLPCPLAAGGRRPPPDLRPDLRPRAIGDGGLAHPHGHELRLRRGGRRPLLAKLQLSYSNSRYVYACVHANPRQVGGHFYRGTDAWTPIKYRSDTQGVAAIAQVPTRARSLFAAPQPVAQVHTCNITCRTCNRMQPPVATGRGWLHAG